jgi:DMSO reductase anchor subunit
MHPAASVILFTTLIGAGQGLFLALFGAEMAAARGVLAAQDGQRFFAAGSALSLALLGSGLIASFFHLGHPERAWRAVAMWRTSWLSREVIVLPVFMAVVFGYGAAHYFGTGGTIAIGAIGVVLCFALFVCTAMIYACLKFLQEWHTPLTLLNYALLGCASGLTLAAAFAAAVGSEAAGPFGAWAVLLTLAAFAGRVASLVRNARLKPKSTLQSAIGVAHPRIVQKAQGSMGGSFNTREFFHGRTPSVVRSVKWVFLVLAFPVPVMLVAAAAPATDPVLLAAAFAVQYAGLLAERWFFFAQANHPQNLYYQTIS